MEIALAEERIESERALVARARSGDRHAFGELVNRYMQRAYYAALGLIGSHEDALDLSQEAFARWLYQIVRRLCFNFLRDRSTRRRRLDEATPWLVQEAGVRAAQSDPAKSAERAELRAKVQAAIEKLPEREREVLVLKEFEGLRYREIAELLNVPIGTVMSRLYYARKDLAEHLGEGS